MPILFTLGKYQIEREVGRGGFAVVYQAVDPTLGRRVAIKVPHAWLLTDPKFVERFRREARLAANLTHPHIVTIHEIGEEQGTPFIVMEWLEGMPLQDWLREAQPTPQAALQALAGVGAALDYAHAHQVIHRDIKPSNIMVVAGRGGVLTDFGIARLLAQATQSTSSVMGTPNYMAPEQLRGEVLTPATDIYAFGVMLYQVLTGRLPFIAETPTAVAFMHASQPPSDPRSLNPALPKATAAQLLQALAKDPRQRPMGAEKLVGELQTSLGTSALAPGGAATTSARRRLLWLGGLGAVMVLFVIALLIRMLPREGPLHMSPTVEVATNSGPALSMPTAATLMPTQSSIVALSVIHTNTPTELPSQTATPRATSSLTPPSPPTPTLLLTGTSTPSPIPTFTPVVVPPGNGRGRIIFSSWRDGNPELYTISADGGNLRRLTNSPGDDWSPAWSRDGQQIAFTSSRDATLAGVHNIYVMPADGSSVRRLTYNQAWDEYADWSPDGSRIAFVTTADSNAELFVAPAPGGDAQRLTFTPWNERNPDWSPDGSSIAFSSDQTGIWQIYVMKADGSSSRQISFMTADSYKPDLSPDGRYIAFHSDQNGNRDVYVMDADGSDLRRLTTEPGKDEHPSWSPDGSAIVFSSNRGGYTDDLYVMWADGSQPTLLFASTGDDGSPAWGP